ncbi:MAG: nucleotide exchange factor GrpE [Tyzzerella sp.]|uniref:Protein GrpE n=1 Tax=Candidatus Fimicola merdigallinarum TaxID=2840819 RepID=A0A9D9DX57_9FIRM|nr:nucleotide exchange factor GrpE [Candidatus Fimicola merdigallinarum]
MEENKNMTEEEKIIDECEETIEKADEEILEEFNTSEDELKEAIAKADEYLDKYQRTLAEFDNFRKRTSKEKASMYDDGIRDTVLKLLPVVDNFERAISSCQNTDDGFYKGIEMILKQFKEIFTSMGVEEIPAVGEKFDPNLHSAVAHEDNEEYGENEIMVEMLKGYKHKDKVIRHSMVKVAN